MDELYFEERLAEGVSCEFRVRNYWLSVISLDEAGSKAWVIMDKPEAEELRDFLLKHYPVDKPNE